ncbi:toxin-antitoxin system YwqK family antitoxin [Flavobacterium wongokense]|uniref:toxin-antitoxin system YwqK family antitoxin n=1 Tax=Flavobacterium wongokense TaxID=2910674 RepID=UPI001F322471|nr:hypothetical protein [Flavobacterium sp. WG47]MCF6133360.1 hypothetical protein [Flavobacterium sp. WG47]
MKNTGTYWFLGLVIILSFLSFQEPELKKRITDTDYKYEFYVTDNEPGLKSDRMYYWFKGGAIHNSENGISGQLLNNSFEKFYLNNQLAEKGRFESGLKVGLWRTWYPNGVLESTQNWGNGRKKGMYNFYSDRAVLIEKGRYSAGKKQGQWINFISKDTITYIDDKIKVLSKEELAREAKRKENKAKRKLKREEKKALKKQAKPEDEKQSGKDKNTIKGTPSKSGKEAAKQNSAKSGTSNKPDSKPKKDNFFKRLFSKKEKSNGKSS